MPLSSLTSTRQKYKVATSNYSHFLSLLQLEASSESANQNISRDNGRKVSISNLPALSFTLNMGNVASIRPENSSDLLLDQIEKQALMPITPRWMDCVRRYCSNALSTLVALLTGNFTVSFKEPTEAPVLVDAACQTENDSHSELTINCSWQSCGLNTKCDTDDDSHSSTTEAIDLFTDAETDELEDELHDEWKDTNSSSDDLCQADSGANDAHVDCDCETHVKQLLLSSAIACTKNEQAPSQIRVKDYLCSCCECPQYKEIAHDVAVTMNEPQCNFLEKQSVIRLLQAFSTYNEVMGYRTDMIVTACDCLRVWCGDEDKAFESFVAHYDELPRLCDAACRNDTVRPQF